MRAHAVTMLLAAGACTRQTGVVERPAAEIHDAATPVALEVADAGEERDALAGFPEIMVLREGKEMIGVVSVPLGAREPRPIMFALHGSSDRPDRACPAWRTPTEPNPFV